jgi:hypothetical protein
MAHYLCEQAAQASDADAEPLLRQALKTAPDSPRPQIDLAALQPRKVRRSKALATLLALAQTVPGLSRSWHGGRRLPQRACGQQADRRPGAADELRAAPSLDVLESLAHWRATRRRAPWYVRHLEREPSLVAQPQNGWPAKSSSTSSFTRRSSVRWTMP